MNKTWKYTLGIVAFITPIVMIPLMIFLLYLALFQNSASANDSTLLAFIFLIEVPLVILTWAQIIGYMINSIKRTDFTSNQKVLWCILLYMLNIFVFPVYWWKHIRTL